MPSTPYDLVRDDQDLRIPLHAEQAFFHGITFQAKVSVIEYCSTSHLYSIAMFSVFIVSMETFYRLGLFFDINSVINWETEKYYRKKIEETNGISAIASDKTGQK